MLYHLHNLDSYNVSQCIIHYLLLLFIIHYSASYHNYNVSEVITPEWKCSSGFTIDITVLQNVHILMQY